MTNKNKKYIIILFILLFAFVSIGGVSSNDIDNTTITQSDIVYDSDVVSVDEAVLIDNTLYEDKNNNQISVSIDSSKNTQNTISDNNSSVLSVNDDSVLEENYQVNSPIVNPSFDQDSSNLVGWNIDSAFVTTNFLYAKDGSRYVSISNQGFISQNVNLNTVDTVSFWYMSLNQGSKVEIWLDNNILKKYTIQNTGVGKNKWEQVNIDLSGYDGYHTLKLVQYGELAYIDYFNIKYNQNLLANFSIESFNLAGNDLTISFRDKSYGVASSYLWDFGDGSTSTEQNPTHTFKLNHYTVTLTLSNGVSSSVYSLDLPVGFPIIERTSKEYFTIQEAINSAIDGDVIIIPSDIFNCEFFGNLVIDMSITLNFNDCTLKNKDNTNPLIQVNNNANVIVNNISLTGNNVFISDDDSSLTIQNSSISNADLILNGNIIINENTLQNCFLTINNGNVVVSSSVLNGGSVIVNGGESKIIGNVLSFCGCAIQQNGGQSNITDNIINNNDVGINITDGMSSVNFNAIYSNNHFGLVYKSNVDYTDNWWATNNPTYTYGLETPSNYFDVYQNENINTGIISWLVLSFNQSSRLSLEYILNAFDGNVKCYNVSVDLTHNNLGETFNFKAPLELDFKINDKYFKSIIVEEGKSDLIFNWTESISKVNLTLLDESYIVPLAVDKTAPVITYITPSTTFDDELLVEIKCDDSTAVIVYTLDGTNPLYSNTTLIYKDSFLVNESTSVHFTAIDTMGNYARYNYTCTEVVGILDGRYDLNKYQTKYYDLVINYFKKSDLILNNNGIWGRYQDNNGVSDYNGSLTNLSKWSNNNIVSSGSAVIDNDGHIYVGGDDGYLYCLNNQGLIIWKYGTTSKIICTPTIGHDGNIYFSNWMNSTVYCLSPKGSLIWKYNLGDYNTGSSPIFGFDGILYILTTNNISSNLFAFKNNELFWNCTLPLISDSTPSIDSDGTIYLVTMNHEIVAVNWDGTIKYSFSLIRTDLTAINSKLKESHVSVTIEDDILYVINQPHYYGATGDTRNVPQTTCFIRAYYSDGTLKWYNQGQDIVSGMPTYYKGILYVVSDKNLIAINSTNGDVLWKTKINDAGYSASSPIIGANEIIYLTQGNMVYAFKLNGEQLWNYTLSGKYGNPVSYASPTIYNDGTLIVTTNQGIFAFNDVSADFTYEHVNGTETTIKFTEYSTKGNNSYFWDFGDGSYSLDQNPVHIYNSSGKYRVVLIVEHNGVNLARNTTIEVVKYDLTPPSNVDAYINDIITSGGVFDTAQNVTLVASDDASSVTIYYTVDGSNPINSSTRRICYEPILIEANTVLNAVAVDESCNFGEVSSISFEIKDALNVNDLINSTLIQKIQDLLDNAEEGSKFVFDYDVLYGANFIINKPLNIITTNNTKLIGNGIQPVFTLSESAKGTTINGFTVENINAEGILIKNASDITVKETIVNADNSTGINIINSDKISIKDTSINNAIDGIIVNQSTNAYLNRVDVEDSCNNGVWIYKSQSTIIANSLLENNGKDPYKSKANQVLIDDSKDTALYNNTINYGYFGVHLYHNTDGVILDNNTIYESIGDAILLSNRYSNVNITHNLIDGCYNGVNFMGFSQNVTIKQNTIENLHEHEGDLQSFKIETLIYELADYVYEYHFPGDQFFNHCYNGFQISHGASNVHEGNTIMIDNVVIKLQHRAWEARKYQHYLDGSCEGYGYNLMDGSDSYHGDTGGATSYREGKVDLVVDRIGDATFRLRLINRLDGHYLSEIPAFDVTFIAGGYSQTVQFKGSEAIASFDVATALTTVTARISTEVQKTVSFNIPITDGYSSSNKDKDSGYEAGEAINNPDPVVPSIADAIKSLERKNHQEDNNQGNGNSQGSRNGNGQGTGTGNGQGNGNGHGSSGHGGSSINGREGEVEGNSNNLIRTNGGTSPSVGVQNAAQGDSDSVEGGSSAGGSIEDSSNAYEVTKVINKDINDNWQFVLAVILFSIFIILGYGYRRGKKDGDEI